MNYSHGHSKKGQWSRTYQAWHGMKQRCKQDPNYRQLDITYISRWENFIPFLLDMGECPEGLTLERVDNNKGYNPENCYWATETAQRRNQGGVRLNERSVRLLRALWRAKAPNVTQMRFIAAVAPLFPASKSTLRHILGGQTWRDIL